MDIAELTRAYEARKIDINARIQVRIREADIDSAGERLTHGPWLERANRISVRGEFNRSTHRREIHGWVRSR